MLVRKILEINEELCDGCGQCILDCAEHALVIVDGKAKIISDNLCDGLGACMQGCPQNALTIIEREAPPFDEEAVLAQQQKLKQAPSSHTPINQNVNHVQSQRPRCPSLSLGNKTNQVPWPLKLRILPENSSFLKNAEILIVSDCAPAIYKNFHSDFADRIKIACCPKFESHDEILHKLRQIYLHANPKSVEVLRMEVPCCHALAELCQQASPKDAAQTPKNYICARHGQLITPSLMAL